MAVCSPEMRVMESRFSTMRMSHWASSLTSRSSSLCCSVESVSPFSKMAEVLPTMLVSGVRISCDIARSRFARIVSRSASVRSRSCFLILVFIALMMSDTASIVRKVSG